MAERKRRPADDLRKAKRKRRDGDESRVALYPGLPFEEALEKILKVDPRKPDENGDEPQPDT